jgi:hypothetical protein
MQKMDFLEAEPNEVIYPSTELFAQRKLRHPCRILYTGRSGMGKTYNAIQLFIDVFSQQVKRLIVICPSYHTQNIYRNLDKYTRNGLDVITQIDKYTFTHIKNDVIDCHKKCKQEGKKAIPTMLIIDDMSGEKYIHGGRIGPFANLSIQMRPLKISCMVIAQEAHNVSPSFRENANAIISFPAQKRGEVRWLTEEYGANLTQSEMDGMVATAWRGYGNQTNKEWGKHFFFILAPNRKPLQYYADFKHKFDV